jgi:hypothetical protein
VLRRGVHLHHFLNRVEIEFIMKTEASGHIRIQKYFPTERGRHTTIGRGLSASISPLSQIVQGCDLVCAPLHMCLRHCPRAHAWARCVSRCSTLRFITHPAPPLGHCLAGRVCAFQAPRELAPSTEVSHIESQVLCQSLNVQLFLVCE